VTVLELLWAVPREGGNAGAIFLIQMLLIFGNFYFLLISTHSREKVVHVEEKRLTLKTAENTRITVDRSRIAAVLDTRGEEQAE
jgi:preprotein translocase subunit YajC